MDTLNYILDNVLKDDHPFFVAGSIEQMVMPIEIPEFTRSDLAKLFAELQFTRGVEIGVEQGEYSETLLKENPKLHLTGVDAWKAHSGYRDHTNQEKLNNFYMKTLERLKPFGIRGETLRKFSMDAVKLCEDNSLDFVYIDANHDFPHVTEDIFHWSKKVRKGGIIAGHDYYKGNIPSHVHVPYVLEGYTKAYNIKPWFIFEDSWMFVKQ